MEEISLKYFPIGRQKNADAQSISAENPIFDGTNFGMSELTFDFNKHVDPNKHMQNMQDSNDDGIFDKILYSTTKDNKTANIWVNVDSNGNFLSYDSIEIEESLGNNLVHNRTLKATDGVFTEFDGMVIDTSDGDIIESKNTQYDSTGKAILTTYEYVPQQHTGTSYKITDSNSDGQNYEIESTVGLYEGEKRVGALTKIDKNNDGNYEIVSRTHVGNDGICEIFIEEDTNSNGKVDSKTTRKTTNTGVLISSTTESDANEDDVFETKIEEIKNEDGTITRTAVEDTDLDGITDRITTLLLDDNRNIISCDIEHTYYALDRQIGNYQQGPTGDCWLLSGLSAISATPIGSNIVSNSMSQKRNGDFVINFAGSGQKIKVTQEEVIEARESGRYSSGDSDVLLFEVAFEKALTPKKNILQLIFGKKEEENPLHGGDFSTVVKMVTGKETERTHGYIDAFDFLDKKYVPNNNNYFVVANFTPNENENVVTTDINGNEVILAKAPYSHACAVVGADKDTVTIVNPWNSNEKITISRTNLVHNIDYFEFCQIF